jgi:glycosyltransferase involved in cell wall biosynthesis
MITYNHKSFIVRAIEGVLDQKVDFPVELIIADDCSVFNLDEKINLFRNHKNFKIIKYLKNPKNVGPKHNYLNALKKCKGKYVANCEGDDYWIDPYKLQKQVVFLEQNPNYSHCWTRFMKLNQLTGNLENDSNERYFKHNTKGVDYSFETLASGWELGIQTLMFRNNLVEINRLSKYKYFRDIHLVTELLNIGNGYCLNFFSSVYRIHHGGIHTGISQSKKHLIAYKVYKEIFKKHKENKSIKHEFRYYFTQLIEDIVRENKSKALMLIIQYYFYFSDRNQLKHQIKQLFGLGE